MTWTFEPRRKATEVTVVAESVPAAIGRADHIKGLNASIENLARLVGLTDRA